MMAKCFFSVHRILAFQTSAVFESVETRLHSIHSLLYFQKKEPLVLGKHLHVLSECPAAYRSVPLRVALSGDY